MPGVGLLLVCWGLWGDRSKGRPRCPKCWCDTRGTVPSLVCPECGHDARDEGRLYLDRIHRRLFAVGLLALSGVLVVLLFYAGVIALGPY